MAADPLWYKDAVIYQTHVKAFFDSRDDGIGDFRGLTRKLEYLQHLGVTAVWVLPFYPSPQRDDGYDISDYTRVHSSYGSVADFKAFLREAHDRGIRVITELVLNHTSDRHPWFQRARRAKPGSRWRNYYVWSDSQDKYPDARIIFQDFETSNWSWDPLARAYYWHRFYHHQPDLNFDNPEVRRAMLQRVDHWLAMGVDGLRLDAVPYLYERDGTNCENLPETHAFLQHLRAHVDAKFEGRMLLAEANQWPEDAVAYFGRGDECHTAFHFPIMPRLFMAVQMEDRFPVLDILEQTPQIPDICQWVLFLRNHDELTLEMVTDEERDYMYRVYARDPQARVNLGIRRRLAPLLGNNRRKIELLNGLLMSLPGTPVIYYGDEIGMGDNIYLGDRNGVRTPMQWSADRNAGFSRANPQKLYLPLIIDHEYHYEAINVENQQNNPHSLFWWTKRLIALRQQYQAFGRGDVTMLFPENAKVLAYIRSYEDQRILVVANLSRFSQFVELDLSAFRGSTPVEMFGATAFPRVGELPYLLTLGPHAFYWFSLALPAEAPPQVTQQFTLAAPAPAEPPLLEVAEDWSKLLEGTRRRSLERLLPDFLKRQRWYGGKARALQSVSVADVVWVQLGGKKSTGALVLLRTEYVEGEPETYLLPLGFIAEEDARWEHLAHRPAVLARLRVVRGGGESTLGYLYDVMSDDPFSQALLEAIASRRRSHGQRGKLLGRPTRAYRRLRADDVTLPATFLGAEQSNSAVVFGDRFLLKLFRRMEEGVNPDLEIGRFLTETVNFPHVPPLAGAIEYEADSGSPGSVAILYGFVRNEGDAWRYTLDAAGRYYERALAELPTAEAADETPPDRPLLELAEGDVPPLAEDLIGPYLQSVELLGQRTAELHLALASRKSDPAFAPEPYTQLHQRSVYQSSRSTLKRSLRLLRQRRDELPADAQASADLVLSHQDDVLRRLAWLLDHRLQAMRIRCHGDYHLGQVLYTGKDFVIIDFEGEPTRPISERRIKRTPLRDVAGMLRSFDYASYVALSAQTAVVVQEEDAPRVQPWVAFWSTWVGVAFLKAYLQTIGPSGLVPAEPAERRRLLDICLIDKAVYELGYELNNRPDWVRVPLNGILQLLERTG